MKNKVITRTIIIFFFLFIGELPGQPDSTVQYSKGQVVYVAAYSNIYYGEKNKPFLLSCILSIRNTDLKNAISISSIVYYNSQGRLVQIIMSKPEKLRPLESYRYIITENDDRGGSGAKFLVKWQSKQNVTAPLIESIMIGTRNQQGVSFTSRGVILQELLK